MSERTAAELAEMVERMTTEHTRAVREAARYQEQVGRLREALRLAREPCAECGHIDYRELCDSVCRDEGKCSGYCAGEG